MCSTCSKIFLTARGLIQHAQREHSIHIFDERPVYPQDALQENLHNIPPPAHKTYRDSTVRREDQPMGEDDDSCNEPTDLSMSCSNKLSKAILKCTDHDCSIFLRPKKNHSTEERIPGHKKHDSSDPGQK